MKHECTIVRQTLQLNEAKHCGYGCWESPYRASKSTERNRNIVPYGLETYYVAASTYAS